MTQPSPSFPDRTSPDRPAGSPDWLLMLGKFMRHGTSIASFVPSSKSLARCTLRGIDFDRAGCIVELGAGTGPITEELVRRCRPGTRLVINELDTDFCGRLRRKFPQADIVEADAARLDDWLSNRGIDRVDHVLSGLPLPSFPADLRASIIAASVKKLAPGGTFRQLTNMPWVYRGLYRKYFREVGFRFVPANFPPAGVYVCRDYSPAAE